MSDLSCKVACTTTDETRGVASGVSYDNDKCRINRWRLLLGSASEQPFSDLGLKHDFSPRESSMDLALAALYDETRDGLGLDGSGLDGTSGSSGDRGLSRSGKGSMLGKSSPNIARWLADIREYFPNDVVAVIQSDAIKRKRLAGLMFEPESLAAVIPDVSLVATLIAMKDLVPEKSKDQARELVRVVVENIKRDMAFGLRTATSGVINRRRHTKIPSLHNTDWQRTISRNLKHYDPVRMKLLAKQFYFFENRRPVNDRKIIVALDQSGSMATSIIYASVMASIFASIPALETHVIAFNTAVVDLTSECANDPVDMLLGIQLGGGTDINRAVCYCQDLIDVPAKTTLVLVTDLFEGGNEAALLRRLAELSESGVGVLVLLSLSDEGTPNFDARLAERVSNLDIPCFGCTPDRLPDLIVNAMQI